MSKGDDVEEFEDAPVEILPKEVRLAEDADDTLPNTLVITVLQARHLQPSTFRDTLSCYVKLSSLGVEYKTSVMTKTREPRWHEVFAFRAVDWTTGVTVSVRDRLPIKMHFIGQVVISSAEIAGLPGMTTQRWFPLRDKGVAGQLTGAELELKVALVYTKANDQELFQSGSAAAELEHGAVGAGLADLLVGQEDETEEEVDARAKALLRREEQEREALAAVASLKPGDYQVQVHIIEARDLKGENITVYDKEKVLKDNLIGIYQLDCLSVYAQWVVLREEISRRQTRHALERTQNPGVLLLRLGFGRVEMAAKHPWMSEGDSTELFAPFRFPRVHREIRVHIFQARGLESPVHVARVPSPAVNVRCCGHQKRTMVCQNTPAPLFYESLVFLSSAPASDVVYTPEIVLQVEDASGNAAGTLGELRLSLASAVRSVATAGSPKPRWYELKKPRSRSSTSVSLLLAEQAGSGSAGQLLVAIQYIDHTGSAPPGILRPPAPIRPKYVEANLDIVALGVRHLKALSTLGIRRPHVEFELIGGYFVDGSSVKRTQSATGSSSKNANFLDRIVALAKLPVDTLYAPQLQIRVCDSTLGGLRKTTLASCIVDLASKLPWSPTYRVEIAAGSGSPFRSPSKRKTIQQNEGTKSGAEESEMKYLFDEGQPEEETEYPLDDGTGVGDLVLPSVLQSHARVSSSKILEDTDPAVIEQRRREQERRYSAGKAAFLLSHQPSSDRQGSVLGSPRSSNRDQEQHRAPYLRGRDWWISQYGGEELEKYFSSPALETYQLKRPVLSRPSLFSFERVKVQLRAGVFKGRITVIERRAKNESRSQEEERAKQEHLELRRLQDGPQRVVVRVYMLRGQSLQAKNANGYSDPYLRLKLGSNRISDRPNACTNTLKPEFFRMFELETTLPGASQLDINVWDRGLVTDQLIGSTTIDLEERWFHREWQEIGEGKLKPIEYRHLYVPHNRTTSQGVLQLWVDILTTQEAVRIEPVDISLPAPKTFEVRVVVWRAENVQDQSQSEINDYFVKAWMEGAGDSGSNRAESTDTHWRCSNGKPCWNWRLVMKTEFPPRSPELARLHIQLWDKDVLKWNDVLGEAQLDLYKWLRRAYETNRSVAPFLELKRLARQSILPGETLSEPTEKGNTGNSLDSSSEDENDAVVKLPREDNALLGEKSPKKPRQRIQKRREPTLAERKQQKDEADAEAALNGLLDFMGLGRLPDDAEWIPIFFTDREAAVSMEMGRIGISVQIVPEEEALASPVGKGQNAPNLNPYLPPPVGRMRLTANPIAMLKVLVGPKMCIRLSIMCCCVGCILFISVFGATVMSTLTYLQGMEARHSSIRTP
ncbi:hypothetical protein AM588_10008483 [Phytophthora nicotianae]|uniref:C2 domain-containing protein n=1 Tax=Phytophthora nicotianae TaxID=4792 RepID=A0A0W8DM39_PHYNI|nr:hypothetical protein AM588_10008483 [Phytophthora nicotianae]